ncbi:MAG TPA: hypothetical protein VNU46_06635 [Gemmatimonadaceae bacterium]|jgi:hypothetical protein|nr:hypothetical protein [Gemmatimonadaceae bacterium]
MQTLNGALALALTLGVTTPSLSRPERPLGMLALSPRVATTGATRPHRHARTGSLSVSDSTPERLVAEAPIWGANNAFRGYAFLPVSIHGHAATVVIDLTCTQCDLSLSTAALAQLGVTVADTTATTFDELTVGTDTPRQVPLTLIRKATWHIAGPPQLPPVVGLVGVHFVTTHYDLLYDFPNRRVRLYALPAPPRAPQSGWLPPGFTPADCGRMIPIPPGAADFTGFEMHLDGHPVTGVLEMGPYTPKMNRAAFDLLQVPTPSPRLHAVAPGATDGGRPVLANVDVQLSVGTKVLGTGLVEVLPHLDVQAVLPPGTPVMLWNLSMLRGVVFFNAMSSGRVCLVRKN